MKELTRFGQGTHFAADIPAAALLCGADAVATALNAVADSVPILELPIGITTLGLDPKAGEGYNHVLDSDPSANAAHYGASGSLSDLLGGPVGVVAAALGETLSNGYKLASERHPKGVDYSFTKGVWKASYLPVRAEYWASFTNRQSWCRYTLWRMHQLALGMRNRLPAASAEGTGPKTSPAVSSSDGSSSADAPASSQQTAPPTAASLN